MSSVTVDSVTPRVALECLVNGVRSDVLVVADTGAARSVFPQATVPSSVTLQPSSTRLRAASGHALDNVGSFEFIGAFGEGPRAKLNTILSPDLHGPPLICYRDLLALGVEIKFPKGTRVVEPRSSRFMAVNMIADEEQQFLGEGSDSLEDIKKEYSDVLCNSLGDAAGCIKGPKMKIELDET